MPTPPCVATHGRPSSAPRFVGKKVWRAEARRKVNKSLPHYPESIDYDIEGIGAGNTSGEIVAEVGPKLGGQGSLGIVEDSPGDVGATPQRNYIPAEKAIAEDLVRGILIAVGDGTGET